jgi:HPr kinase/phosphorylase
LPAPSPTEDGQRSITLQDLLDSRGTVLQLENLTPDVGLDFPITDAEISGPGLALAGWRGRFADGRMLVFGETEMTYIGELDESGVRSRLTGILGFDIPAIFVTKGQHVPPLFLELASEARVPVLLSRLVTKEFYRRIKPYLEAMLAPVTTLHGSLADVYGVGLLFMGKSGVGKSECVLDLVERGHRLVADDLVFASRHGADILIGKGHELQRHHMEIRGIGIIDVRALFGIRATRLQKRIEVVVQLEHWDAERDYTRTGLDQDETEIHGVMLPRVTVPLNPGKNITVISEVIAMNRLLRYAGVDSAAIFDQRIRDTIRPFEEYLEWDQE